MIKEEDIKIGDKFRIRTLCKDGNYATSVNVYEVEKFVTDGGLRYVKEKGGTLFPCTMFMVSLGYCQENNFSQAVIVNDEDPLKEMQAQRICDKLNQDREKLRKSETEQVSHPSHYAWLKDLCGIEPLDICRHLDFNVGNAIKYLLRKDKVDGNKTKLEKRIEDLKKAKFYIEDEIKLLENGKD